VRLRDGCRALVRVWGLLLLLATALAAQGSLDWSRKPVVLLTMGQGEEVFEKFGHNAIVVWDDAIGEPVVYNWGTFDFEQPNFIGRFLTGDTKYWLARSTLAQTIAQYRYLNRTLVAQEVQLAPGQRVRLVAMLAENALEQNRYYRYDYYRDNCSTRVRDALDAVTGGVIRRTMEQQPGEGSYRWQTRRLLAYSAPLYFGSQLVLGVNADAPLSGWGEAFLPRSLAQSLMRVELPATDDVPARPLLAPADTLFRAERTAEPSTVPPRVGLAAVIGALVGAVLLGLVRGGRVGAAAAMLTWSIATTVVGVILLLAWFATRHEFMANNPSVALLNPIWLLGVVAAVMVLRSGVSPFMRSALRWLLIVAVTGTAAAVLAGHAESAMEIAALVLPGHAAVVYAADRYKRRTSARNALS